MSRDNQPYRDECTQQVHSQEHAISRDPPYSAAYRHSDVETVEQSPAVALLAFEQRYLCMRVLQQKLV